MSVDLDAVKQRVREMLNLARNNGAAEGEIANALKFARRLMDAHHLEEDDLAADPHEHAAKMDRATASTLGPSLTGWEASLAHFVCDFVGGVSWYNAGRQYKIDGRVQFNAQGQQTCRVGVVFYGTEEDSALAVSLYTEMALTIASMGRLRFGGAMRGRGRDYCVGFVKGLKQKLGESRIQDKAADETSRGLIVRAQENALAKLERAETWLAKDQGVKLQTKTTRYAGTNKDGAAYTTGVADGRSQNVSANRAGKLGQSSRRLA